MSTAPVNTAPPPVFGEFGLTLAFAERALTATLREHLARRDTRPETWYALNLIARRGPGLARDELSRDLEGSPRLDVDSTRELLAGLEAQGLITGDAHVDLTADGQARYRSLREYISGSSTRLLSQFDLSDIETTVRTLQAITRRVQDEAASASSASALAREGERRVRRGGR